MRVLTSYRALGIVVLVPLFAGCSSGSAVEPNMSSTVQRHAMHAVTDVPSFMNPVKLLKLQRVAPVARVASFNGCPASGTIEYVSDMSDNSISIYVGNWAQHIQPCGMVTSASGLSSPEGLTVHGGDLYVANTGAGNILAFHRGATTPFAAYVDATGGGEFPVDVSVQRDATVVAANFQSATSSAGSLSTWNAHGNFIGNFVNPGAFGDISVTVQRNGKVYFDDSGLELNVGACPLGACGTFANTGATGFGLPGILRSASYVKTGFDVAILLEDLQAPSGGSALDAFTSFPGPPSTSCAWPVDSSVVGFDINHTNHHVFGVVQDPDFTEGIEMTYPGCAVKGEFFPEGPAPALTGVAVDRPGALD